jgi:anti-sigma factor RsiW
MNCESWETAISKLLDGELDPSESSDLFRHLAGCHACRLFYSSIQKISGTIEKLAIGRMRDEKQGGADSKQANPRVSRFSWNRTFRISMRAAALVTLSILLLLIILVTRTDRVYVTNFPMVVTTAER